MTKSNPRLLVIAHDVVGHKMAGPGIRYYEISKQLAKKFPTTLAVRPESNIDELKDEEFTAATYTPHKYKELFQKHDVIFATWLSSDMIAYAKQQNCYIIFDLYAPVPVEYLISRLHSGKKVSDLDSAAFSSIVERYRHYLKVGDYFLVSNDRQRDFWMGYAVASGRFSVQSPPADDIDAVIGISPMAVELSRHKSSKPMLKGVHPHIKKSDTLIVWTGGIWDWFDPITAIDAIVKLKNKSVKLVFLGTKHPNKEVPMMKETQKAIKHAQAQGVHNKQVIFLDGWLSREEYAHVMMEADYAVSAHKPSIETRYSHRSRILAHLGYGLPTIATDGDFFAEEIQQYRLGVITPIGDSDSFATAIEVLLADPDSRDKIKSNIRTYASRHQWSDTTKPIVNFIENLPKDLVPMQKSDNSTYSLGNFFRKVMRKLFSA